MSVFDSVRLYRTLSVFDSVFDFTGHCSTFFDFARLCSTMLDIVRLCSTLFDFTGHCSTLSGISRRVLNYNDTRTSLDCFCQITFQKSQPGQPQNKIEKTTKLSIVDLCSPS